MSSNKRAETTMLDRRKWLKEWIKLRNFDVGVRSESFLFCYHCTNRSLYSKDLSRQLLYTMNAQLIQPLNERTLESIEGKDLRWITNKKIILWLGITQDEIELLRIGHNQKAAEERLSRQFDKAIVMHEIQELYANGSTTADIAKRYPQISKRTIQRYINTYREENQTQAQKESLADAVMELYQQTADINLIARRTKCSADTVRHILNLQGMTEITKQETKRVINEPLCFKSIEGLELFKLSENKTAQTDVSLNEQSIALDILRTYSKNLFIQGTAGTGKSFLIQRFLEELSAADRAATLIVAPTGKAADNLGAQTIHKAFQFPNEVQLNDEVRTAPKHLFSISRIIIDEINMVRLDVFSRLVKTIRFIEQQTSKKIQVIALGDFGQIQPVATPADMELLHEFYPNAEGVYAFHSEQWQQLNFRKIVLKHIHRQDDPIFKEKLNEIKYGNLAAIQWFNENSSPAESVKGITICPTNKLVDRYNKEAWYCFDADDMETYQATYLSGKSNDELPCPEKLQLAVEMRVMTVCNSDKFKNGSVGTIIQTNKNSIRVQFDNGVEATVKRHRFSLQDGVMYEQIPVVLAYAITANKAEGMTFKEINIVPGYFAPGQLYTALSRCTSINGIYIDGELTAKDLHIDIDALRMTVDES